jgi:hypothetical protein
MSTIHRQMIKMLFMPLLAVATAGASADPVVYTLRTVADGKLGSRVFSEALVTIQMKADTETVQQQPSTVSGGIVYTNTGRAAVTIDDGTRITVAKFAPGEVYVRYDNGIGVAGFGSSISPSYPIALDCSQSLGCTQGDASSLRSGTLGALVGAPHNYFSQETNSLPATLLHSTLLTGPAFSCATAYTVLTNPMVSGPYLGVCGGPAPRGLHTDRGDFFLQDQVGGSTGNALANDNQSIYFEWDFANYGSLQVQAAEETDE